MFFIVCKLFSYCFTVCCVDFDLAWSHDVHKGVLQSLVWILISVSGREVKFSYCTLDRVYLYQMAMIVFFQFVMLLFILDKFRASNHGALIVTIKKWHWHPVTEKHLQFMLCFQSIVCPLREWIDKATDKRSWKPSQLSVVGTFHHLLRFKKQCLYDQLRQMHRPLDAHR